VKMVAVLCSQTRVAWENHILEDLLLIFLATESSGIAQLVFCIAIILQGGIRLQVPLETSLITLHSVLH
jgi:hypothetical protein